MIEVFKTNVNKKRDAKRLCVGLLLIMADTLIHFDLEDCDRVLRVENKGSAIDADFVITFMRENNFQCEILGG